MTNTKVNPTLEEFGKHLQQLRVKKNHSLRQLGIIAGVEPALIHRIEKGKNNPRLTTILILAQALEVHPKELFKFIK